MKLDAIYQATLPAGDELAQLRLTAVEWLLFEALFAPTAGLARKVAGDLGLDPLSAETILGKLQTAGLIHEPLLTLAEYRAQFAPAIAAAVEVVEPAPAPAVVADDLPVVPPVEVDGGGEGGATVSLTMKRSPQAGARPVRSAAPARELQPLVDLVRKRSGGGALGEMAVYQMFLQVPLPLLEGAGFQPVPLEKSALKVEDPLLMETLRVSACQVLGIPRHALEPLVN